MDEDGGTRLDDGEVEERLGLLDDLLERVEAMPGEDGDVARDAVTALAVIYGEALARAIRVTGADPAAVRELAGDALVGRLMALHGLHPDPPQLRVEQMLNQIQDQLGQKGSVRLSGIENGVARVEVIGSGCGTNGLDHSVEDLLLGEAPELARVDAITSAPPAFIPLGQVKAKR